MRGLLIILYTGGSGFAGAIGAGAIGAGAATALFLKNRNHTPKITRAAIIKFFMLIIF